MHALLFPWDVDVTAVAEEWILGLKENDYTAMLAAIELLEEQGPTLVGRRLTGLKAPVTTT